MASTKDDIKDGIIDAMKLIKVANGYQTDVARVYGNDGDKDDIPMGLSLDEYELPAVLAIPGDDQPTMKHQCWHGAWHFELQLWHNDVSDTKMLQFVRDVFKSIYAGNATSQKNTAFRGIHPAIYDIKPLSIVSDLNMIEDNRCYIVNLEVQYEGKLWDL